MRPPATYWQTFDNAGALPANIACLGANLHLAGIEFGASGNFVAMPSVTPPGGTAALVTIPVRAGFYELVPAAIDASSTCFPMTLFWGPLGVGAR